MPLSDRLDRIARGPAWWLGLIALGVAMEATALYYQYALDYYPCVLCIHVRIWTLGVIVLALIALAVRRRPLLRLLAHGLTTVLMAGLLERSWRLLGTERGFIEGSCTFDAGLPPWFALDRWLPWMFQVQDACGYTPELLFGVTMAEALTVLAATLLVFSAALTLNQWSQINRV